MSKMLLPSKAWLKANGRGYVSATEANPGFSPISGVKQISSLSEQSLLASIAHSRVTASGLESIVLAKPDIGT